MGADHVGIGPDFIREYWDEFYSNYKVSRDLIELRNIVEVADLIIRCALNRKESRGLHYTLDFPEALPAPKDTVLVP